jgi:hypothetical protein
VAEKTRSSDKSVEQSDLDAVMEQVPKGALALGGLAVLLLLIGWCFVYFSVGAIDAAVPPTKRVSMAKCTRSEQ